MIFTFNWKVEPIYISLINDVLRFISSIHYMVSTYLPFLLLFPPHFPAFLWVGFFLTPLCSSTLEVFSPCHPSFPFLVATLVISAHTLKSVHLPSTWNKRILQCFNPVTHSQKFASQNFSFVKATKQTLSWFYSHYYLIKTFILNILLYIQPLVYFSLVSGIFCFTYQPIFYKIPDVALLGIPRLHMLISTANADVP